MHILVVEDEQRLARLVARVLGEERHVVDVANDGDNGLYLALRGTYDVIVLDLMLPGGYNGLEICREVRAQKIPSAILMLTARGAVEDRVAGLRMGADDYLVKPFALHELLARLRALLRRNAPRKTGALILGDLIADPATHAVTRAGQPILLSTREFALLEYSLRHPRQILTREMIESHIWNFNFMGASNVVDVYVRRLRRKIDDPFPTKMIETARGLGYRIRPLEALEPGSWDGLREESC